MAEFVFLAEPLHPDCAGTLEAAGFAVIQAHTPADTAEARANCVAAIGRSTTRFSDAFLAAMPNLRGIATGSAGFDNIDLAACRTRGIVAFNAAGGNADTTADFTLGLILAAMRQIPQGDASMKAGRWERKLLAGTELATKRLAIVGIGRVGSRVARRALAFGMTVAAFDPYVSADDLASDIRPHVRLENSLDDLLAIADVLTIHTPLTEETRNLLSAAKLATLRPSAVLVNAARGGLLDEAALAAALHAGTIAAAAVDVFSVEPLPADSPLLTAPNVVLTPHIAGSSAEAHRRLHVMAAEKIVALLRFGDIGTAL